MPTFDFINPPDRVAQLVVETTTLCSLECAGCPRTIRSALGKWTDRHMSAARFRKIIDHAPRSYAICLQGVGEPTLNPEFPDIVSIAKNSGKYDHIFFNTHGLARNAAYFERLFDLGLSSFSVSVDSLDPHIAQRLRAGTDVEKLKRRIQGFAEKRLAFAIGMTVSKHNLEEIPETLAALNRVGEVHRFSLRMQNFIYSAAHYHDYPGAANYSHWVLDYAEIQWLKRTIPDWQARFANIGITYEPVYDGAPTTEIGICDAPRTEPWIDVDGTWGVCCIAVNTSELGYINIERLPFDRAWRTEPAQQFLERYSRESPRFCDACPKNCGRFSPGSVAAA